MGSIENLMRNPNSRSTMHVRPIEDRSFYPKIKQKFNQNISPDFSDYNPNSGTGNVIYIQTRKRNPKQNIRSNISSYNNTLSSSTGSVDLRSFDSPVKNSQIHLENRIEKAFYPKSLDSANAVTVSPFLISSIALPKVNGQIVSSRSFPHGSIARKARSLPILLPGILGGSSIEEMGSQTNDYDLKRMALSGKKEHKIWRDEVGGPFIEALRREVMKNRPADLEDFVVAFCEARLQGRALPETTFGQNGGVDGVKLERKAIIKIMKKDTSTSDPLSRRGSSDGNAPFTGSLKRGSFSGTPLLDFGLQKRGSFSNGNLFVKGTSDPSILGAGESIISIRRDSNQSTVSSEDSSNDI